MQAVLLLEFMLIICLLQARRGICQDLPVFSTHPQGSVVKSGASISLNCVTDSSSDMIQWYLSGQAVDGATSGTLIIDSFGNENRGNYSCLATRTTGSDSYVVTSAEAYVSLASLASPNDTGQTSVTANLGEHVTIPCIPEYSSLPTPRFTWYHADTPVTFASGLSSANSAISGPDDKSILLRNVSQTLAYRCQIDNDVSGENVVHTTEVTLSGNPVTTSDVVMVYSPQDALVNEGETLTLYCIATDTVMVTWSFNGNVIISGVDDIKFITGGTTRLLISEVLPASAGTYTCTHPFLGDFNASVSIRSPPTITGSPGPKIIVDYNTPLSLTCATAETVTEYKWYHNGIILSVVNADTLLIPSVSFDSIGTYQCYAYNAAGNDSFTTFVNVHAQSPEILDLPPPKQAIFSGDRFSITCVASGIPSPMYSWLKDGSPIIEETDGDTLTFDALVSADSGSYTCNATNIIGSSTASTQVAVIDPTVIKVAPSNVVVYIDQVFSLRCTETHDSVKASVNLMWFLDGQEVKSTDTRSLILEEGSLTLQISNTKESDAGEYSCHGMTIFTEDSTFSTPLKMANSSVMVTLFPVAPVVTVLEALSSSVIEVSWNYAGVVSNLKHFVIETKEVSGTTTDWEKWTEVPPKVETRKNLTGLTPYTEYMVRVGAVPLVGSQTTYSNATATPSVKTLETVPEEPTDVTAIALEDGTSITVSWQAIEPPRSNGVITGYTVRYFPTNTSESEIFQTVSKSDTTYTIMDLTPDTEYTIDVAGHTKIGVGSYSDQVFVRTESTAPSSLPLVRKVWFIALMVAIVFILLVAFGAVVIFGYWKKTRGGKYPVSHSIQLATDGGETMTEDTFNDYEKRKKDIMLTNFDGADSELDGSAVTLPTTISSFAPSHLRVNVPVPPSYINPPSFEDTLRAKSHSMSAIDRAPHPQYGSGWSMGHHDKPDQYDEESVDKQVMLGAESGSSEDSGVITRGHSASTNNFATFV